MHASMVRHTVYELDAIIWYGAAHRDKLANRKSEFADRDSHFCESDVIFTAQTRPCVWVIARLCGRVAGGGLGGMPALRIALAHIGCLNATRYGAFLTLDCGI